MTAGIREARPEDVAALGAIACAAYSVYVPRLGFEPPPMRQDFFTDIAAGAVWLAGDPPQGFVVARPLGEDWLIENLARAPGARRGLGRRLLAFAEDLGLARGHARVTLYTNEVMTENLSLYPRLGYEETARRAENGLRRVWFVKTLGGGGA